MNQSNNHSEICEIGTRIKFGLEYQGAWKDTGDTWKGLARILEDMQECGCMPLMHDGRCAGNVAVRVENHLIVSRSGRMPGNLAAHDFVKVMNFDKEAWTASYESSSKDIHPTSDTPLYWTALIEIPQKLGWKEKPSVALHGHVLSTAKAAKFLDLPISASITEFSTPADQQGLAELLRRYPYPQHKIYIRRGHGFFILAESFSEIIEITQELMQKSREIGLIYI